MTPLDKERLIEYRKCKQDAIYFITKYVKIELPGGSIPMPMYEVQKDYLTKLITNHHVVSLKSRQTGISTTTQAYITWVHTFFKGVVVGVVSKDGEEATDFCRKTMSMIESIPKWMRPTYKKQTEQTYILDNGCKFYASTINPKNPGKLFRGKAITIAVMDEAAHTDYIEQAFVGFGPALVKSQTIAKQRNIPYGTIVISTPNKTTGIGAWYYDTWKEAQTSKSIYVPITIYWKDIPEFADDPDWYETQRRLLKYNDLIIRQELELEFIASEGAFFEPETIKKLNKSHREPIKLIRCENNYIKIWELPKRTSFYMIGIDTATAYGSDLSALIVVDWDTMNIVAEFHSKLRVDSYIKVIEYVEKMYKNNLMIPENNSVGNQVMEHFTKELGWTAKYNIYLEKEEYGEKRKSDGYKDKKYGLTNTGVSRPLILDSLYTFVSEDPTRIKSQALSLELIGLEEKSNNRVEASRGKKDDIALAYSFCTYVRQYKPLSKVKSHQSEYAESMGNDIINMNDDTMDSPYFSHINNSDLNNDQRDNMNKIIEERNKLLKDMAFDPHISTNMQNIHSDATEDGDFVFMHIFYNEQIKK